MALAAIITIILKKIILLKILADKRVNLKRLTNKLSSHLMSLNLVQGIIAIVIPLGMGLSYRLHSRAHLI